jgi:hypothetical protein
VQEPVEQDELVEQLSVEHRLQVDFDEGGARQRGGIPQQPELPAVGQDSPEVLLAAVKAFLQHRLRRQAAAGQPVVQVGVPTDQLNGDVPPLVRDREGGRPVS